MTRLERIQLEHPKVTFLTSVTHQSYGADDTREIEFNCKDMTVTNNGDYEVLIAGTLILQPGDSEEFKGNIGEYKTGSVSYRFGNLIGPGTTKQVLAIRTHYAE